MFKKEGCTWSCQEEYDIVHRIDKAALHKHHKNKHHYYHKHIETKVLHFAITKRRDDK